MKTLLSTLLLLIIAAGAAYQLFPGFFKEIVWNLAPIIFSVQETSEKPINVSATPFTVPDGFAVSVFASTTPGARDLTRDPRGVIVVSQPSSGLVVALPDVDNNNVADSSIIILGELNKPHGVVFRCESGNCSLYVAEENRVVQYDYNADTFSATNPRTLLILPAGGGHSTRTLLLHPDNIHLLVSVGSSCNVCKETDNKRASVQSLNLTTGDTEPFALGLRNTVFMTIHPVTGEVWGTDNGRDLLGDNLPPDEINILRSGSNYGWPFCYGKNIPDLEFSGSSQNICNTASPSHVDVPAHSAALGIGFIQEEGWSEDYWFNALVAYHGSWNRSTPTGYKIVRIPFDTNNNALPEQDFMTGFVKKGEIIGRPVDVMIEPGGTVYVSDDRAGAIYRVYRTGEM